MEINSMITKLVRRQVIEVHKLGPSRFNQGGPFIFQAFCTPNTLTSLTIINFFGSNPIKNTILFRYLHKLTNRITIKPITYAASRSGPRCFL